MNADLQNKTYKLSALEPGDLLRIQKLLLQAGFSPGPLDGLFGPRTMEAWIEFKESVHLHDPRYLELIGGSSYERLREVADTAKKTVHDFSTASGTQAAIRWECNAHGLTLPTQHAYVLATVQHETAGTWKPLEEYGRGRGRPYGRIDSQTGRAYYGRGFVQLTWKSNYQKYSNILGINLVSDPSLACNPNVALFILVHGFRHGTFTGRRLTDYVRSGKTDFIGARRCINGTDRAQLIAKLTRRFL